MTLLFFCAHEVTERLISILILAGWSGLTRRFSTLAVRSPAALPLIMKNNWWSNQNQCKRQRWPAM